MNALSGAILGATIITIGWLYVVAVLLARLADADRRARAWQDECAHARRGCACRGIDDAV